MSAAKPSSEQAVVAALDARPRATVAEVAAATGLGRSTVGKALARLERAGRAHRGTGQRESGRRLPDRWSLAPTKKSSRRRPSGGERLRAGELDGLVLDYLAQHTDSGPLSPPRASDDPRAR